MKGKSGSTFDRIMKDPKRRARFDDKYTEFLLSEILLELMEQEEISVRALASKAGISPAVIQDIRSGKRANITINNLVGLAESLGATVRIQKGPKTYLLAT